MIDVFRLKSSEAEKKSSREKGSVISQNVGLPECLVGIHHPVRIECWLSRIISLRPLNLPGTGTGLPKH